jgi:plastocyanin
MSLKLPKNKMLTVLSILSAALILGSGLFLGVATASPGPTITAHCTNQSTVANGCTTVVIDEAISENLGYSPSMIYVHHGEWITIKDASQMEHTFTLVSNSFEPHTVAQINACDAETPGTICLAALLAHVPGGVPPTTAPPFPYPKTCYAYTSPVAYQCVKDGTGLPNGSPFPGLSTPFTSTTGGDSLILFPGQSITVQVTAPAGTVLHYMCVIHPWMQGEIVVTN